MKANIKYRTIQIDKAAYMQAMHVRFAEAIKDAAKLWLMALSHLIPVWSGSSKNTFTPLANAVGMSWPIAQAGSAQAKRARMQSGQGTGGIVADAKAGLYYFTYSTTLPHLVYNEYHDANAENDPTVFYRLRRPGPYNFQAQGQSVFRFFAEYMNLPNPMDYLRARPIK